MSHLLKGIVMETKDLQVLHLENGDFATTLSDKYLNRRQYSAPSRRTVSAMIPGTILDIYVTKGQAVKEGDALCVMDSMKMNNTVCAPASGRISDICITTGDSVGKGHVMFEFE